MGGGTGYLTRKHGLTVDNLLEVDVVLADGSFVSANKDKHADLFWAVRGGGGNFGVVTSFLFQAHPAKMVFAGPIFWDANDAKQIMATYRDFIPNAPEELGLFVGLKTVPPTEPFPKEHWNKRACALIGAFNGPIAEGQKLMWDGRRVEQLLMNLVTNAMKYGTPRALVRVILSGDEKDVRIDVINSGPAIDPAILARIFEPLNRGAQPASADGGLGLGLYIAQEIAKGHGGEITARSAASETIFTARLPRFPTV